MPKKPPPCLRRNHILWFPHHYLTSGDHGLYLTKLEVDLLLVSLSVTERVSNFPFSFPQSMSTSPLRRTYILNEIAYLERYKISSQSGMIMGTTVCLQGVLLEDRLTNSFQFTPDFPMSAMKILHSMKLLIP